MRKFLLLFVATLFLTHAIASVTPDNVAPNAKTVMVPIGKTGNTISLYSLAHISVPEYETLSGHKMGFLEKIGFKKGQKQLRKQINTDGTVKDKLARHLPADGATGFHLGGFALGFLLGLIGVLLAYVVFNDENKRNRIKWSWIGLAAAFVLGLGLILAIL